MIGVVVDEVLRKMESATNEGIKAADDYIDADTGLLMCGQCHTKKQRKVTNCCHIHIFLSRTLLHINSGLCYNFHKCYVKLQSGNFPFCGCVHKTVTMRVQYERQGIDY